MAKIKEFFSNKLYLGLTVGGAVLLVAAILLVILLPGKTGNTDNPVADMTGCTVEIKSEGGKALEGVGVYLYADAAMTDMIDYVKTDAQGVAAITRSVPVGSVAVLDKLPAGYVAEASYTIATKETKITLQTKLQEEMDRLALGDVMFDFTVTDINGTQHTLSKLLETKKAVVINLWYVNCQPCKAEFPYLIEAYGKYAEDIEVLAINPEGDSAEAIASFAQEYGLTFPAIEGDEAWKNTVAGLAYPTTVIIDRFGAVGLIHIGGVDSAKVFEDAFAYFVADGYVQSTVEKITDVATEEIPSGTGTKEDPQEFAGVTEFTITVPAGADYYCNVYRVSGMELKAEGQTLKVTFEEKAYESEEGVVKLQLPATTAPGMPFALCFTNTGAAEETYKITFAYPEGSEGNPLPLQLGKVDAEVAEGNAQGTYLTYTAEEKGNLILKGLKKDSGYGVVLYNLATFAQKTLQEDATQENGETVLSVPVNAGDEIRVLVTSDPDAEGNYPGASVSFTASVEKTEEEAPTTVTDPTAATIPGTSGTLAVDETKASKPTAATTPVTSTTPTTSTPPATTTRTTPTTFTTPSTKGTLATVEQTKETKPTATTTPATSATTTPTTPTPTTPTPTTTPTAATTPTTPAAPNTNGTLVNPDAPVEQYGFQDFSIEVGAGEKKLVYLIRTINKATLCISDKDAYVVFGGTTYTPVDGKISIPVESDGSFTPLELEIGNSGTAKKTFAVEFAFAVGTRENPGKLQLGDNTVECAAGNDQGTYYNFEATKAGKLTLQVKGIDPATVVLSISINDMQMVPTVVELEEGSSSVSIDLPAGAKALIIFSTKDPNREWKIPAATVTVDAAFA